MAKRRSARSYPGRSHFLKGRSSRPHGRTESGRARGPRGERRRLQPSPTPRPGAGRERARGTERPARSPAGRASGAAAVVRKRLARPVADVHPACASIWLAVRPHVPHAVNTTFTGSARFETVAGHAVRVEIGCRSARERGNRDDRGSHDRYGEREPCLDGRGAGPNRVPSLCQIRAPRRPQLSEPRRDAAGTFALLGSTLLGPPSGWPPRAVGTRSSMSPPDSRSASTLVAEPARRPDSACVRRGLRRPTARATSRSERATARLGGDAVFVAGRADHRFSGYESLSLLVVFNGPHSASKRA